ncbi:MAG TPA: polysaccharide biosynthesis/export family protein [Magnetospirillaceae bacterium]|jgi:protein involved in polysaccharide export with SLBB domain
MAVKRALCLLAVLLAAACTRQTVDPKPQNAMNFSTWTDEVPAYRYGPGDKIQVSYQLTPEMDETALVSPDGTIALKTAHHVKAEGLTETQLEQSIEKAATAVLIKPIVTVELTDSASAQFYVGGSVTKPGSFPAKGRIGLLEAVTMAGGFDREARYDQVILVRRSPDNRPMLRIVDLQSFIEKGSGAGNDVPLVAGDMVFVPRSEIGDADLWVEEFITKFVPFDRSLSYSYTNVVNPTAAAVP